MHPDEVEMHHQLPAQDDAQRRPLCALLPCWIRTDEQKPPKHTAVLVDGKHYPTPMVAVYQPDDEKWPWLIWSGHEETRYGIQEFDYWAFILSGPAR